MIRSTLKAGIKRLFSGNAKVAEPPPAPPAWREAPVVAKPAAPAATTAPVAQAPVAAAPSEPAVEPAIPAVASAAVEVVAEPEAATALDVAPVAAAVPAAEAAPAEPQAKGKKKSSKKAKEAVAEAAPEVEAAPAAEAVPSAESAGATEAPAEAPTDTVGPPAFSLDQVQELFDEMVRPALQGDGGDIKLVKIENNDIYVRLVGSCQSCPSSVLTMKMGVEALLKEELPGFGALIQVD